MPWKAVKTKNKSKIGQADATDTLTLNNQFKCLEQYQIYFTKQTNKAENINTETQKKQETKHISK